MNHPPSFPRDFVWGAATSAYQIEGSPLADGAGISNWHHFTHLQNGKILNDDTGDKACDHFHRYLEDVALMQTMGLKAYRLSLAWSRIMPDGRGPINSKGLDFYKRLLDQLNRAGIVPYVTLHHWDMPLAIDHLGGWAHRDSAHWFSDYAAATLAQLGDRVTHWATFNEPWVIVHAGYIEGAHPPGISDVLKARDAAHNLLRGHGLAVQAFRAEGRGQMGIVINLEPKYPGSERPEDLAATARMDAWMNRQFLDPLFLGHDPLELEEIHGAGLPPYPEADYALIQEPIDYLGINYYSRSVVRDAPGLAPFHADRIPQETAPHTDMDWEIYPDGLKHCLLWVQERYGDIPLYITENGAAFDDGAPIDERVRDTRRIDYLRSHLLAAREAMAAGVDLRGYFAWSLLDNFEWAYGYAKRFGLIHVDYDTLTRTLKDSALFYREVIDSDGQALWR